MRAGMCAGMCADMRIGMFDSARLVLSAVALLRVAWADDRRPPDRAVLTTTIEALLAAAEAADTHGHDIVTAVRQSLCGCMQLLREQAVRLTAASFGEQEQSGQVVISLLKSYAS